MFVTKNISFWQLLKFTWFHLVWLTLWGIVAVTLYHVLEIHWLGIPWLPVSVIGIAVSFFVGFKNNSSYGRMWEARMIWGAIVNYSRSWAVTVRSFLWEEADCSAQIRPIQERLIRRHIAWLYTLRAQLLVPAQWEHAELGGGIGRLNQRRRRRSLGDDEDLTIDEVLATYLPDEAHLLKDKKNAATQILDLQSQDLSSLRQQGILSDYRFAKLQELVHRLFDEQGKSERIKGFPFPRQYATGSYYFIGIFILLLPFGMLTEFEKLAQELIWLTVPFVTLVGWVFVLMELIGDYSENPFEGLPNDVPLKSICRTIEIDLLQMIGEEEIPPKIKDHKGILM
jgi:putative membrane protein